MIVKEFQILYLCHVYHHILIYFIALKEPTYCEESKERIESDKSLIDIEELENLLEREYKSLIWINYFEDIGEGR